MKRTVLLILTLVFVVCTKAATVDTLMVYSKSMDKTIPNLVITPDGYNENNTAYPVVYLLHGAYGDFKSWLKKAPDLPVYADQYNFIMVCPDGGYTSWYYDSPIDPAMRYETYITREVVAAVDKNYNTIKEKKGRAITGFSMGGHGAFYLSFRNLDVWGAAGSSSGGLDILPFQDNWDIPMRLGHLADNKEVWEENSVINMVYLLQRNSLKLIFDCGVDDFFYDANKRMHEKLLQRNIPHDYIERPGGHTNAYWANAIKYQLLYFKNFFNSNKEE